MPADTGSHLPTGLAGRHAGPFHSAQTGLWDGVSIVIGIVVGVRVFKAPPLIFSDVSGPWQGMGVWVLGGLLSVVGALCYAELATRYPRLRIRRLRGRVVRPGTEPSRLVRGPSLLALRRKDRGIERPFSVPLYPLLPVVFCPMCVCMLYCSITHPKELSLFAVVPVLLGLPLYFISRWAGTQRRPSAHRASQTRASSAASRRPEPVRC